MTAIYSARWVLPIASPPIESGAVAIDGDTIVAVGAATELRSRFPDAVVSDFGASAILPGLVNAHSHLELTVMRGFLENEEHDFFAWLRKLTIARMAMTADDLFVSACCGAIEAARAGVTCVGDSSSAAAQAMKALKEVGLRGIVYQESFGPDPKLAEQSVANLRAQLAEMRALESEFVRAGVSPHAPYTVSAPQLELISRLSIDEKIPLMMHAAESRAEQSLLRDGTGAFADGLRNRGIVWTPPGVSTVQYLRRHGILETKPLLAHCIAVDDDDIETIAGSAAGVAHCPRSNAKLRHGIAPFAKFVTAGLKVGLGSDSVASNNNCDILEEARFATLMARVSEDRGGSPTNRGPHVGSPRGVVDREGVLGMDALADARATAPLAAEQALFAATLGGARALRLDDRIGALAEGMQADLVVVGLNGTHQQPVTDPTQSLIFSSSGRDVQLTIVGGKEIYREGRLMTAHESGLLTRLGHIRKKLDGWAGNKQKAEGSKQ